MNLAEYFLLAALIVIAPHISKADAGWLWLALSVAGVVAAVVQRVAP